MDSLHADPHATSSPDLPADTHLPAGTHPHTDIHANVDPNAKPDRIYYFIAGSDRYPDAHAYEVHRSHVYPVSNCDLCGSDTDRGVYELSGDLLMPASGSELHTRDLESRNESRGRSQRFDTAIPHRGTDPAERAKT